MTDATEIHWLTLRFSSPEAERVFQEELAANARGHVRRAVSLGAVLYALFAVIDPFVLPEAVPAAWFIRFAVVVPACLALLAFSYTRFFTRFMQPALSTVGIVAGLGIVAMADMTRGLGQATYYAGLLLVGTFIYVFLRLRFLPATLTSWGLAVAYFATIPFGAVPPAALVVNNVAFVVAFNLIGMSAAYSMELELRRGFLQRKIIADQAAAVADALAKVKVLAGLLPFCAWCHKVRNDDGYWQQIEAYVTAHSDARFSHGICPACSERASRGESPED